MYVCIYIYIYPQLPPLLALALGLLEPFSGKVVLPGRCRFLGFTRYPRHTDIYIHKKRVLAWP